MVWLLYFFVTIYSWQRQVSPLCIDILWIIKLRLQDQYHVLFSIEQMALFLSYSAPFYWASRS